jgi:tetratricopeptide (TPR) repeat protein
MSILKSIRKANETVRFNRLPPDQLRSGILSGILAVLPAILPSTTLHAADDFTSPIFGIVATNELEVVAKGAAEERYILNETDPSLMALNALDSRMSTNRTFRTHLPTTESIGTIELDASLAEQDIDVVVEKIRVKDILTEAEKLVADDQKTLAIDKLVFELQNIENPESKYKINHQIGLIYYGMGKFEEAAVFMEAAVKLNPRDAAITCNLSAIYLYLGKVDDALEALAKISTKLLIQEKAHNMLFSTHFNYACAYALKAQREEALAHLELAARYDPINTLTSMSDTQLDNIRGETIFKEIQKRLELIIDRTRR